MIVDCCGSSCRSGQQLCSRVGGELSKKTSFLVKDIIAAKTRAYCLLFSPSQCERRNIMMFGPRETTTRFAAGLCLRTLSNWFCFRRRSSLGSGIKNGVCMIWRHNVNSGWINEEYKCKSILHAFFIHRSLAVSFIMDVTPLLWFPSALGWISLPWCDRVHTSHRIFAD